MEERPVPTPGPRDVLVEVASVGVCGSDVHWYQHGRIGDLVARVPLVLGPDPTAEVPLSLVQNRELWLTGTFRYANTYPAAIELAATGRVDVAGLITGHYGLDDTENALLAGRNDAASIKVMVHPRTEG
jgi:L-iditol 2-dehydrogenase